MQQVQAQQPVNQVMAQPVNNVAPDMHQVMENAQTTEYVDPNVVTLSTGFVVRFKRIPKTISDAFVTSIFNETELDDSNNIRVDTTDRNEQIRLAGKFMDLNSSILAVRGATLVGDLPEDSSWLEDLLLAPTIMQKHPSINPAKLSPRDKEFLFLQYYAFGQDDLALLSERCLSQGE